MSSTFLSKKINKMIDYAFKESFNATHKHKMGCVIYDKGILARTHNIGHKTHPRLPGVIDKLHAEMRALKNFDREDVKGAYMIVVRGSRTNPRLAKPCPACLEIIQDMGIKKIIYTTDFGFEILTL